MSKIHKGALGGCVAALLAAGVAFGGPSDASTRTHDSGSANSVTAGALAVLPSKTATASYHEETFRGEFQYPSNDYKCGGALYKTDSVIYTPAGPMRQYAWIYHNCGWKDVRRRAIVKLDRDGPCYTIPAYRARTIEVKYIAGLIARNPYERSASC